MNLREELLSMRASLQAARGAYPHKLNDSEVIERRISGITSPLAAQATPGVLAAVPMDTDAEYMDKLSARINSVPADAIEITSHFRR